MSFWFLLHQILLACSALACMRHSNDYQYTIETQHNAAVSPPPYGRRNWSYVESMDWGRIWPLCQAGMQQSPIALSLYNGLSQKHLPVFNYPDHVRGKFKNWGFGPAFDVEHENDVWINNPRLDFDDETVYLAGWHIHTPADHTVNGLRTRAELHLVHKTSNGIDRAIVAVLMDPGSENHTFIDQFPTELIKFNNSDPDKHVNVSLNLNDVLQTASAFKEFWTYEGSVTSPPCNEGVRWFVARPVLYMSNEQMRNILAASAYSSRPEQMVWMHRINE